MADYIPKIQEPKPTQFQGKDLLEGKKCVVTGGALGIGRQIVYAMVENGAEVAILDINKEAATEAVELINSKLNTDRTFLVCGNVADKDILKKSFAEISDKFGGSIDLLVSNVGVIQPCRIEDIISNKEAKTMDQIIDINVKGTIFCAAYAYPLLVKGNNPVFIMIGSCASVGSEGQGVYAASKAALHGILGTLAKEWRQTDDYQAVRVGLIEPDYLERTAITVRPEYWEDLARARRTTVDKISNETVAQSKVPLKREAKLTEISETVIMMGLMTYVNGEVIIVSGGKTMRV